VAHGRRSGLAVALGINTGVLIWGAAAAAGISELLVASRLAYDAVRFAGAIYLAWLGGVMLWRARRRSGIGPAATASAEPAGAAAQGGIFRSWWRGVATNLLNPKIAAFYIAVLPQFIPARAPHLLMGLILASVHDAEGITWFAILVSVAHVARRFLDKDSVRKVMDRITGTVLIGFGLKLALSQR
jgi:threonine/homoserine/homoserine lactone efflux protein